MKTQSVEEMNPYTATYSPDDNKLRLYCAHRLDAETYAQAKALGFRWAPKQELFVAPMWAPQREDFLLTLVDEIGDEDTGLVDRAEERAERFEEYSEKRAADAEQAHKAVAGICDQIPLGQPILIGHHSEKHARRAAEKIENGMRRAVKMWDTSKYWERRAAGALAHAKYKELPEVRARRIKAIEADRRKYTKGAEHAESALKAWSDPELTLEKALVIAGVYRLTMARKEGDREDFDQSPDAWSALSNCYPNLYAPRTLEEVVEAAKQIFPKHITRCKRWIAHFDNRLAYEKVMLGEQGRLDLIAKKARPKQLPLLNYRLPEGVDIENRYHRGEFIHYSQIEMTKAEYAKLYTDDKGTEVIGKSHRVRAANTRGQNYSRSWSVVFLTDSKEVPPPKAEPAEPLKAPSAAEMTSQAQERTEPPELRTNEITNGAIAQEKQEVTIDKRNDKTGPDFEAMRQQLKIGVRVAVAPQLFSTPTDLAARMVEAAGIEPGDDVLDPSAGTGALIKALPNIRPHGTATAVEINHTLSVNLEPWADKIVCADFLSCGEELGKFDKIIMNPPFKNGADIKHIKHALTMLRPGGRLVAICADGPRQQAQLKPLASTWEPLPAGTFASVGTMVNTALLVIDAS